MFDCYEKISCMVEQNPEEIRDIWAELRVRFKAARMGMGLNQEQASEILGVSQQVLSSFETGRHTPRPQKMASIQTLTETWENDIRQRIQRATPHVFRDHDPPTVGAVAGAVALTQAIRLAECPHCGEDVPGPPKYAFCGNCGEPLGRECKYCGTLNFEPKAKRCMECGEELPKLKQPLESGVPDRRKAKAKFPPRQKKEKLPFE
jgi:transcriptional regulator with XRE-family HTH domain